nr:uncharacterized protein CI109_004873 [Kwoniella shandongensis]KAA5526873.1 hypothetical protein CI109_004873 [Kwoniella shandongensis]
MSSAPTQSSDQQNSATSTQSGSENLAEIMSRPLEDRSKAEQNQVVDWRSGVFRESAGYAYKWLLQCDRSTMLQRTEVIINVQEDFSVLEDTTEEFDAGERFHRIHTGLDKGTKDDLTTVANDRQSVRAAKERVQSMRRTG